MFSPPLLDTVGGVAMTNQILGAIICTVAVIAMSEVGRAVRYVNVLLGLIIVLAPFVFSGASSLSTYSNVIFGLSLMALSIPRGEIRERYGILEKWIF